MSLPLRDALRAPFDPARWRELLAEIFASVEFDRHPVAHPVPTDRIRACREFGRVKLADGRGLVLLEIAIGETIDLLRNRVELRNLVARFIDQDRAHGVLAIIRSGSLEYRLTFASRVSEFDAAAETFVQRETATRRFTYVLGHGHECHTASHRLAALTAKRTAATLDDVIAAFNVEPVSKEFFTRYKEHYAAFCAHLLASDAPSRTFGLALDGLDEKARDRALKPVRDFVKKLLGRVVFLHFLQKKGWLGCPAERTDWCEGDPRFLLSLFERCTDQSQFHSRCLAPLFFETLNNPNRSGQLFAVTGSRIPYLNGGLFERDFDGVERIDFPAPLFAGLLKFFGQYHFTIDENDPDDHEIGIDPEMLSHIFENLLEDNKDKGAYYTPKAVVQYMCQQSLIHALCSHFPGDAEARAEIEKLIRHKEPIDARDTKSWLARHDTRLEEILDALKICDPAIGSGAFPIGLLQEIFWTKMTLHPGANRAQVKRAIIQNSIHGVDLDGGAVEIARLRFWLALIVDEDKPEPLPNLDYQIMQGNSLLESFEGMPLDRLDAPVSTVGVAVFGSDQQEFNIAAAPQTELHHFTSPARHAVAALRESYFTCHDPQEKARLRTEIDAAVLHAIDDQLKRERKNLRDSLTALRRTSRQHERGWEKKLAAIETQLAALDGKSARLHRLLEDPRAERPFFLWHLWFREIFAAGGFDIVIANPPYVRQEAIKDLKPALESQYEAFDSAADLYVYFMEAGVQLLRDGGILTFITSNSFLRTGYGQGLRRFLQSKCAITRIVDFGGVPVFESAKDTYVCIPLFVKGGVKEPVEVCSIPTFAIQDLAAHVAAKRFTIPHERLTEEAWSLKTEAELAVFEKVARAGKPLGEYIERKFFRGILTGLNEAFELNDTQRDAILAKGAASKALIKPFVGGQDIRRYHIEDNKRLLIVIPCGWTRNQLENGSNGARALDEKEAFAWLARKHPGIAEHLLPFAAALKRRQDQGDYWWELRPCDYYTHLDAPKIIFPDICKAPRFAIDRTGIYLANTAYCLGSDSRYLLGILNSRLFWFAISNISIPFGIRAGQYRYRLIYQYMEKVPIHVINFADPAEKAAHDAIEGLVDGILAAKRRGDAGTRARWSGRKRRSTPTSSASTASRRRKSN